MSIHFDFNNIVQTELGFIYSDGVRINTIAINSDIKSILKKMLASTLDGLEYSPTAVYEVYEPAQKYSTCEKLYADINTDYLETVKLLFNTPNFTNTHTNLSDINKVKYYFGLFNDSQSQKVIAIKRAAQFKGAAKARGRVGRMLNGTLAIDNEPVIKFDFDFDFIITSTKILILRPTALEAMGVTESKIFEKGTEYVDDIASKVTAINFDSVKSYVATHKRAAKLAASISSRNDLSQTDVALIQQRCAENGISLSQDSNGLWFPNDGQEYHFLMLLDRRRFSVELIKDNSNNPVNEKYDAPNRKLSR
jgi:hypothetical protein